MCVYDLLYVCILFIGTAILTAAAPSDSQKATVATSVPNCYQAAVVTCVPTYVSNKRTETSEFILWYLKLRSPSNFGTLAAKLVREAYFGKDVLAKCTVAGDRDWPGLPIVDFWQLRQTLFTQFPNYWRSPHEFKQLWCILQPSQLASCAREFVVTVLVQLLTWRLT